MYELSVQGLANALGFVRTAYPREASGVLIDVPRGGIRRLSVIAAPSEENTPFSFVIRDRTLRQISLALDDSSRICGCFHSHVFGPARPSKLDCAADKAIGDLWLIYSLRFRDLKLFMWDGRKFGRARFRVVAGP